MRSAVPTAVCHSLLCEIDADCRLNGNGVLCWPGGWGTTGLLQGAKASMLICAMARCQRQHVLKSTPVPSPLQLPWRAQCSQRLHWFKCEPAASERAVAALRARRRSAMRHAPSQKLVLALWRRWDVGFNSIQVLISIQANLNSRSIQF